MKPGLLPSLVLFTLLQATSIQAFAMPVKVDFDLGWIYDTGDFAATPPKPRATGYFIYDTDTPASYQSSSFSRYSDFSAFPISWEVNWNGMTFTSNPAYFQDAGSAIDVTDDHTSYHDQFHLRYKTTETGDVTNPGVILDFQFWLTNPGSTCPCGSLSSTVLPLSFDLSQWGVATMTLDILSPTFNGHLGTNTNDVGTRISVSSESSVSVPEPGALALLGLGLTGLALARRGVSASTAQRKE